MYAGVSYFSNSKQRIRGKSASKSTRTKTFVRKPYFTIENIGNFMLRDRNL